MTAPPAPPLGCRAAAGFSLPELAVVLVIVTLLTSGLLVAVTAQQERVQNERTQARLEAAREAILGFAQAHGRLPCPATLASTGLESFCSNATGNCGAATTTTQAHGRCFAPYDGFVPAATLALAPVDSASRLLADAWDLPIRYAVPDYDRGGGNYSLTQTDGIRSQTLPALESAVQSMLHLCASGDGVSGAGTGTAACAAGQALTTRAVAVIHSSGRNGRTGGSGSDEQHNPNPNSPLAADRLFVSHETAPAGTPAGEFDDLIVIVSPYILYARLFAAGRL